MSDTQEQQGTQNFSVFIFFAIKRYAGDTTAFLLEA
jgi:hypothetical protein